jgi:hypothetical protein
VQQGLCDRPASDNGRSEFIIATRKGNTMISLMRDPLSFETVHAHRVHAVEFDPEDEMLHIQINEKVHGKSHFNHVAPVEFDLSIEVVKWLLVPKKRDALLLMLRRAHERLAERALV